MEEAVEGQHADGQGVQEIPHGQSAVSAAPVSASNPEATAQWQQAMQHWQALQQQGQQARPKSAPFYPVGPGHPAYNLWAGQPLMYGAPFYSMPFTYPPASSTAQMPTEHAPGVATGLVEGKPSDADGEAKDDGDDSEPDDAYAQASNDDGTAGQEGLKPEAGGVQQPQTQPEGLQYLLPPDAAGNHAAALAALLRANHSTGENAELWRQQAAQLAGSGVDLSQLAATAAGQGHIPHDDREVKRQRRKQSNRESARRSRLRKQSECEALAIKVKELEEENIKLKETVRLMGEQLSAAMEKASTG